MPLDDTNCPDLALEPTTEVGRLLKEVMRLARERRGVHRGAIGEPGHQRCFFGYCQEASGRARTDRAVARAMRDVIGDITPYRDEEVTPVAKWSDTHAHDLPTWLGTVRKAYDIAEREQK